MDEAYAHHLAQAAREEGRNEGYLAGRAEAETACDVRVAKLRRAHELEIVDAVADLRSRLGDAELRLQGRVDDVQALQVQLAEVRSATSTAVAVVQAEVAEQIRSLCERYETDLEVLRAERDAALAERDRTLEAYTSPERNRRAGDVA